MRWILTRSLDDFLRAAGPFLRAEPALNTVPLTVCETLRRAGLAAYGDSPPWFGWHEAASGTPDGAVVQTPPFPLLATRLPEGSATSLIEQATASGIGLSAANLDAGDEAAFTAGWLGAGGGTAAAQLRSRLYRLARLMPPDPAPAGRGRLAGQADTDLLVRWHEAFHDEIAAPGGDARRTVEQALAHDGVWLWEDGGQPVAMGTSTPEVAGVVRVNGIYTPPEHRRCGYGGAVTTAVTRSALAAAPAEVVLFTDLANATSNALYRRLGYQPVSDRVLLELGTP
jgi:ribosomal protein S18 acetylase RimI-like enzyme